MKVGDLVQWYTEYSDCVTTDIGIVHQVTLTHVFIRWQTGDGDGWFCPGHPSIGVISEGR